MCGYGHMSAQRLKALYPLELKLKAVLWAAWHRNQTLVPLQEACAFNQWVINSSINQLLKKFILLLMFLCVSHVYKWAFEKEGEVYTSLELPRSWGWWPWTPDRLVPRLVPCPNHRYTPCQQRIIPILFLLLLGEESVLASLPVICSVLLSVGIWLILHFFQVQ